MGAGDGGTGLNMWKFKYEFKRPLMSGDTGGYLTIVSHIFPLLPFSHPVSSFLFLSF